MIDLLGRCFDQDVFLFEVLTILLAKSLNELDKGHNIPGILASIPGKEFTFFLKICSS